jgi:Ca2+-binding EF-hand superfamily protein
VALINEERDMKQIQYPQGLRVVATLALVLPGLSVAQPDSQRVMEQLDTDGDNLISYEEFEPPRQRGRDRFEGSDTDGDGNLSREEMEAQLAKQIDEMTSRAIERFEAADLDGDGLVSAEERKRAGFDRMDADGDGYISADELEAAHRARRDHHRPPPKG